MIAQYPATQSAESPGKCKSYVNNAYLCAINISYLFPTIATLLQLRKRRIYFPAPLGFVKSGQQVI